MFVFYKMINAVIVIDELVNYQLVNLFTCLLVNYLNSTSNEGYNECLSQGRGRNNDSDWCTPYIIDSTHWFLQKTRIVVDDEAFSR